MMSTPASYLSQKTFWKTRRKGVREQCSGEGFSARSRLGRRQTSLSWTPKRLTSYRRGAYLSAWIHNGQPSDVESVIVDGQFIMRNHKVLTMDEDSIIAEADTVGRRIWNQVLKAGPLTLPGRSR